VRKSTSAMDDCLQDCENASEAKGEHGSTACRKTQALLKIRSDATVRKQRDCRERACLEVPNLLASPTGFEPVLSP
jgi:hypothetical protein